MSDTGSGEPPVFFISQKEQTLFNQAVHEWIRKVWRYQGCNNKPKMEEEQTMQWPKEKGQTMIYKTLQRKLKIEQHEPH